MSDDRCYIHAYITEFPDNEDWLYEHFEDKYDEMLLHVKEYLGKLNVETEILDNQSN